MQPELAIAEAFGLGGVQGSLVLTAAGWGGYNTVSRLVTSSGHWAVKRHGWRVMPDSDSAFGVELDAYVGGVPMARPVPTEDGGCWATVDGFLYRCHEWIDGEAKDNETTSVAEAGAMGCIVALLHGLKIACRPGTADQRERVGRQGWEDLAAAGEARRAPWAGRLREAADILVSLEAELRPTERGNGELVGSHGDLNGHNVLFSQAGPRLIDWDGAGLAWPRWERANYAVLWAQRGHGRYDRDAVLAFLRGYLDGGGTLEGDDPIALRCAAAALAPWVIQNIRMALDRPSPQQDVLSGLLINALIASPRTITVRQALLTECLGRL